MRVDISNSTDISNIIFDLYGIQIQKTIGGITTDSRNLMKGDIYIAIKGENNDGHNYLNQVDAINASAVIVDKNKEYNNLNTQIISVDDTIKAIGNIAKSYRQKFTIPIIGITGSNGKHPQKSY